MAFSLFKIIIIIISFTLSSSLFSSLKIVAEEASSVSPTSSRQRPFKKIYAFGDSYTDTGNTKSVTGPRSFMHVSNLPYGKTFFHHPTNRYSDGRLVIDFVSQTLSLPFLPPYLDTKADRSNGVNFAVAGSTAIIHSFFVENNMTLNITPQSLQTQLNWFNRFLEEDQEKKNNNNNGQSVFDNALIWVGEIGANDYAYTIGSSVSSKTIQHLSIASVTSFLKALLNKGAKYIVVQGLPPTGCLTLAMALLSYNNDKDEMGCIKSVNTQSYQHNTILQQKLTKLRYQFPHSQIVYADYWNSYSWIMKNPNRYGFEQLFKVCCGSGGGFYNFNVFDTCGSPSSSSNSSSSCPNPSQYINWDGVHLTEAMYKAVADLFINGTFTHPPFHSLLYYNY